MTATVALSGVGKRFRTVEAVRDVSFSLDEGEIVALVGHNGAGKTTLMKLMLGLIQPTAGSVRVLGEDPASGAFAARRRLGFLPESVSFNSALTGRETLAFYARLKGEPVGEALALLERVGLGAAGGRRVGTYSKGMRQRLGLAQALIGAPRVLLLDEPTTGLDPALRQSFYEILQELRGRGATILLSSHALSELEGETERVVIMNRGAMVADGSLAELRRLARLPVRVRLTAAGGLDGLAGRFADIGPLQRVNGHAVEIAVDDARKIEVVRRALADETRIEDIEVTPPSLDELYAHFLRSGEARP
ncbi:MULTISPECIES: ABC transporter ATP-binding protein [unclassified Chelatococcus]|uniref:ABC transporter ATP-binding protein n=1 Tax=unclassified Chelatococcus TaxID=2638111 RepID=UPI0002E4961E|nr:MULTISPECIES: ABC transporter ATP-binding protein [unclassified Chelatococcus]ALA20182.1 ABC transporter ATP-binding protein [Chelatococcus sp. CO-6]